MVEITINTFNDIDIHKVAKFMHDARRNTVFHDEKKTIENIEKSLEELATNENDLVLIASDEGEIRGVLRIYIGFPEIAFTAKWHPIIGKEATRDQIAEELLEFCKAYVKSKGFSRFETLQSPLGEEYSEVRELYQSWYEKAGFLKATKEVFMQVDLNKLELPSTQPKLPGGLRFESIDEVENDRIEGPFLKSFTNGRDRLFLNMTRAQQLVSFNHWLRRSRPFHRASILVMKDDDVIGLNVVRQEDDKAEIGPVGIIPEFKRKGIMGATLHESLKRLKEDGVKFGQLEADSTNEPALNLYKKYGFETQYEQEYYAWRVE